MEHKIWLSHCSEETSRVICSLDTMRLPTSYNNMIKRNNSFISTRITAIGRIVKQELGWGEIGTVIHCVLAGK